VLHLFVLNAIDSLRENVSTLSLRKAFSLLPDLHQNKQQVLYEKETSAASKRAFFFWLLLTFPELVDCSGTEGSFLKACKSWR